MDKRPGTWLQEGATLKYQVNCDLANALQVKPQELRFEDKANC